MTGAAESPPVLDPGGLDFDGGAQVLVKLRLSALAPGEALHVL